MGRSAARYRPVHGVGFKLGDSGDDVNGEHFAVFGDGSFADEHGDDRVAEFPVGQPGPAMLEHDLRVVGCDRDAQVQLHPQPHLLLGARFWPVPGQGLPGIVQLPVADQHDDQFPGQVCIRGDRQARPRRGRRLCKAALLRQVRDVPGRRASPGRRLAASGPGWPAG